MTTTTTRAGFVVATDNTDGTDHNITCYDNNITQFENELGTTTIGALPSSGNYEGRVAANGYSTLTGFAAPGTLVENFVRATSSPNAQNWISLGTSVQLKTTFGNTWNESGPSTATVNTTSTEVFQSVPADGAFSELSNMQVQSCFKFSCQVALDFSQMTAATLGKFVGKFNIFVDPTPRDVSVNPPAQPTPTTPGAIRLSFPIQFGADSVMTHATNGQHVVYGELFWTMPVPQPSWPAQVGFGVSAYLSATSTNGPVGTKYDNVGIGSSSIQTEIYRIF